MANDFWHEVKEEQHGEPTGHAHGDELDDDLNDADSMFEALCAEVPDTDDGVTTAADAKDSPPTGPADAEAADPGGASTSRRRRGLLQRVYTRVPGARV